MTIKEIAAEAGVGVSTVSRYLNDGYVSESKRAIIAKVIADNNYKRNEVAANMRGSSREIVVIVQRVSSSTTSRFLEGIIKTCEQLNYVPTIHVVNFNIDLQMKYINSAVERNVFGIIIYSFTENLKIDFDNVLVVGQKSPQYKSIYSDGKGIYKRLVTNVIRSNPITNIKVFGIDILDVEFINRVAGSIEAAKQQGIDYEVWEENFDSITHEVKLEVGTYYVALTDAQAYQIIQLANQQGFTIGKDIFISGYGDYTTSGLLELTSVDGMYELVGEQAVNAIADADFSRNEIAPKIVYRKSASVQEGRKI
ncbi:LacI family DNA-binding transcriptional regulator [Mollicutes bacterium LVI A0039]|nr:LacI family DNA-binding transcriptional regulator [Mollicutes bacterium LVI A0039]